MTAAVMLTTTPQSVLASLPDNRQISIFNPHTQESLNVEYWTSGWYNPDALASLDVILRDWRTDEVTEIDPGLIDLLAVLQRLSGSGEPMHVLCGYRSAATNAQLAARRRGVADNSFHIHGMAVDLEIPGLNLRGLRDQAIALAAGGVGYYPRSGFLHVDTGPVRTW
jgi:uncharacterized protein YcbK (DUF882 family)